MRQMKRWLFMVLAVLAVQGAWADMVGYGETRQFSATNGVLTARHFHNWGSRKISGLFLDFNHHQRFFTAENDFAYVELLDSAGKVLFHAPSPALTYLWISPDSEYLVGLSSVMLYNPYQLVVWRRDGTLLHSEHISAEVASLSPEQRQEFARKFPEAERFLQQRYFTYHDATYLDFLILGVPNEIGEDAFKYLLALEVKHPYSSDFSHSVTNWVGWFDEKNPDPKIVSTGGKLVLQLRSPNGRQMEIPLTK